MNITNAILNAINLCLNGKKVLPQSEKADINELLAAAKKHALANVIYLGLKKDGSYSEQELLPLNEYGQLCTFQYLRQEQELHRLCKSLKERNIRFVLLKGSKMREYYPSPELRSSCDIDILTDASDEVVFDTMKALGYEYEKDGRTTLNFAMPPLVTVEMHRYLFDDRLSFCGFFDSIWDRVVPASDGSSECYLTEEDFYIYMIAHLVKHFSRYGCGLRPLLDIYLYERAAGNLCDFAAVDKKLEELELLYFTKQMRLLLKKWFEDGNLSEQDEELTDYIMNSGIYGTRKTIYANEFRNSPSVRQKKRKLFWLHVFPPIRIMRPMYPRLLRCAVFLPVAWIARFFRILLKGRRKAKNRYLSIQNVDEEYVSQVSEIMKRLHLQ